MASLIFLGKFDPAFITESQSPSLISLIVARGVYCDGACAIFAHYKAFNDAGVCIDSERTQLCHVRLS